jgi:hypothetical protein
VIRKAVLIAVLMRSNWRLGEWRLDLVLDKTMIEESALVYIVSVRVVGWLVVLAGAPPTSWLTG